MENHLVYYVDFSLLVNISNVRSVQITAAWKEPYSFQKFMNSINMRNVIKTLYRIARKVQNNTSVLEGYLY